MKIFHKQVTVNQSDYIKIGKIHKLKGPFKAIFKKNFSRKRQHLLREFSKVVIVVDFFEDQLRKDIFHIPAQILLLRRQEELGPIKTKHAVLKVIDI